MLLVSARVGDNRAFEMTSGKDVSLPMLIYVNMIFVESFLTEIQCYSSFLLQEWINKGEHLNSVFPFFFSICSLNPLSLLHPKMYLADGQT